MKKYYCVYPSKGKHKHKLDEQIIWIYCMSIINNVFNIVVVVINNVYLLVKLKNILHKLF